MFVVRSGMLAAFLTLTVVPCAAFTRQVGDDAYVPRVRPSATVAGGPVLLFDQGHNNLHQIEGPGDELRQQTYRPFGRLAEAVGFHVRIGDSHFAATSVERVALLVVANPAAVPDVKETTPAQMNEPAFRAEEIEAVRSFVARGGALFLIADHYPIGGAASGLAGAFGVVMGNGYANDPAFSDSTGALTFEGPRLGTHPILKGRRRIERVRRVGTFTGQSLTAPAGATGLLRFGPEAREEDAVTGERRPIDNHVQLVALTYGKGRVVVAGEAAMFTAQMTGPERTRWGGLTDARFDDEQLTVNILRWLVRAL